MSQAQPERFVEAINTRQYDALSDILTTEFHGYIAHVRHLRLHGLLQSIDQPSRKGARRRVGISNFPLDRTG